MIYMMLMLKWTGRDLNPKPSPCKGDVIPGLTTSPRITRVASTMFNYNNIIRMSCKNVYTLKIESFVFYYADNHIVTNALLVQHD